MRSDNTFSKWVLNGVLMVDSRLSTPSASELLTSSWLMCKRLGERGFDGEFQCRGMGNGDGDMWREERDQSCVA